MSPPSIERRRRGAGWALVAALLVAAAPGCREDAPPAPAAAPAASAAVVAPSATPAALAQKAEGPPGDPERGRALVVRFECNRCHDGTGLDAAPQQKHCVHCHQDILGGKFSAPAATLARWKDHLGYLREVPSLGSMGKRYKRDWIAHFLVEPYDLRPRLPATMPRLPITEAEARDVAAYLTRDVTSAPAPVSLEGANAAHGRELVDQKGCGTCHQFTGVAPLEGASTLAAGEKETRSAVALAPDLRYARDFMGAAELVAWIQDPLSIKKDTLMAQVPMTPEEARDIAAYVLTTELAPAVPKPIPARLPVLTRRVSYDEVMEEGAPQDLPALPLGAGLCARRRRPRQHRRLRLRPARAQRGQSRGHARRLSGRPRRTAQHLHSDAGRHAAPHRRAPGAAGRRSGTTARRSARDAARPAGAHARRGAARRELGGAGATGVRPSAIAAIRAGARLAKRPMFRGETA